MTINIQTASTADLVDELGLIKAQIAELEAVEKRLKEALIAGGQSEYFGTYYDATVSHSDRETLDAKRLRADLGDAIIADYVKTSHVITVRAVAKK